MDEKFPSLAHESFFDLLVNFMPRLYGRSSSIDPLVWKLPLVKRGIAAVIRGSFLLLAQRERSS